MTHAFTPEEYNKLAAGILKKIIYITLATCSNDGQPWNSPLYSAFYGPKIDFMVEDSLGREWQLATCQLDYTQPENFDMNYVNEKGENERPAILHIAALGSVERFMGILIEHFAGSFPTWLAPIQVKILPISDKVHSYALGVEKELIEAGIRVETDLRSETLQAKIRDAQLIRVPYMLIVGDREEKEGKISIRKRDGRDLGSKDLNDFINSLKKEIEEKVIG